LKVTKAHSSVTEKATNTAPSAGNRGQKRKSEVQDSAASLGHDEHPPTKKGKAAAQQTHPVPRPLQKKTQHSEVVQEDEGMDPDEHPSAKKGKAAAQQTRPVPRPLQKKTQRSEVVQEDEGMDPIDHRNTKKRPSEAVNPDNDPKTPVPSKKVKTGPGLNEKSQVAPIRRTGEPIFFSARLS
jgi:hypothetical protein